MSVRCDHERLSEEGGLDVEVGGVRGEHVERLVDALEFVRVPVVGFERDGARQCQFDSSMVASDESCTFEFADRPVDGGS